MLNSSAIALLELLIWNRSSEAAHVEPLTGCDATCPPAAAISAAPEACEPSAFDLAADELLDPFTGDIVGDLARRMFHRVGRNRVERPADLAIARQAQASNRVDHDAARVGRILHRH